MANSSVSPSRSNHDNVQQKSSGSRKSVRNILVCFLWCLADTCRFEPVIFILSIVLWSYYAYVVELCFYAVTNVHQKCLYLLGFHVAFVMFLWSYLFTIFTHPGKPQKRFQLSPSQLDELIQVQTPAEEKLLLKRFAEDLPVLCRHDNGDIRYCKPCASIKPDRSHHCSICRECILKMDHHCPWVNNCVGFGNYKFFILFLLYATLYCVYVTLTDFPFFLKYWDFHHSSDLPMSHRMQVIFLGLVAAMFILGVVCMLSYHIYLVLNNKSTVESMRAPIFITGEDKRGFGIGWRNNFIQVFGERKRLWLLPIFSSIGDGNSFPNYQQEPENGSLLADDYNTTSFSPISCLSHADQQQQQRNGTSNGSTKSELKFNQPNSDNHSQDIKYSTVDLDDMSEDDLI